MKQFIPLNVLKGVSVIALMSIGSQAYAGDSVQDILKQYYPQNHKGCMGVFMESAGYCVKVDKQKTVETKFGKRHYVLTTGSVAFDKESQDMTGSHLELGLVGMFVLRQARNGSGWVVESANPKMMAGNYGNGLSNWSLHQFAGNTWGFLNEHGDAHQGYYGSHFVILTPNGKGGITESWIGSSFDSSGTGLCEKNCDGIEASIKIDRSTKVNNFYPLNLTLNGLYEGTKYTNKSYRVSFKDAKNGYVAPDNYPLLEIEY